MLELPRDPPKGCWPARRDVAACPFSLAALDVGTEALETRSPKIVSKSGSVLGFRKRKRQGDHNLSKLNQPAVPSYD